MHVSFHKWAPGFFPGTGLPTQIGEGPGKYHNLNIPLKDGCSDRTFLRVFEPTLQKCLEAYRPEAIVLQVHEEELGRRPR
jgi:acetoin utilization deacetylase AcuC-like enzyme